MEGEHTSHYGLGRLIAGPDKILLEHRIFNTAAFIFFILSGSIALSALLTNDGNSWMALALLSISAVFVLIYYSARYKKRFFISSWIFVLFTLIFNDVAWCWSIALTPAANYFFVLIAIIDLTILKVRDHLVFMIVFVGNLLLIDLLAYSYPEIVLNHYEQIDNISFPFRGHGRLASLVILISVVLFFFKKNYERERSLSKVRSRQLMNVNAALDHRNQHLESMARMVSHNLRSPMAGLKMMMQLYERMDDPAKKEDLMKNFKEGANVLFEMVDDLSEIMLDYRELVKEQVELNLEATLETVKKQLTHQIQESHAVIEADFSEYPRVHYSKYFLESIFLNMISNAIKYKQKDNVPVISIRSFVDKDRVMLSFADDGIGIDLEENGDQIFRMYKTFHNRQDVDSRGIGLFMTKNQVEMLGGKVEVTSELNKGTTFYVELYRL